MTKIDAAVAESVEAHKVYKEYQAQSDAAKATAEGLKFIVAGRIEISFKVDFGKLRVFVGPTELTGPDAITLAKGLLDVLGEGNK